MPKERRYSHQKRWGAERSARQRTCPSCGRKGALRQIVVKDVESGRPERAGNVCRWSDCGYRNVYWEAD